MKNVLAILLVTATFLTGCAGAPATQAPIKPEVIVETYLRASSSGDIDTCLGLLSDDVVFRQVPLGIEIKGKPEFEVACKHNMEWNHKASITSPLNVDGDRVTCSIRETGDDLKIIGIEYMDASV